MQNQAGTKYFVYSIQCVGRSTLSLYLGRHDIASKSINTSSVLLASFTFSPFFGTFLPFKERK